MINADDTEVTARYKKKYLKDEHCQHTVMETASVSANTRNILAIYQSLQSEQSFG